MATARGNYKAYFNAFDEQVQTPKIPDSNVVNSTGIKARDQFILRCSRENLLPGWNGSGTPDPSVLIYFHPGLSQMFYVMGYRIVDGGATNPIGDIVETYGTGWHILKVGNNGCPFKIRPYVDYSDEYSKRRRMAGFVDDSGLNIKAARVVSGGIRISNVGLRVSDVIQIKQDYRLPVWDFASMMLAPESDIRVQSPAYPTNAFDEMLYGCMMTLWNRTPKMQPMDSARYQWSYYEDPLNVSNPSGVIGDYHPMAKQLLGEYIQWENAPFHMITPSGALQNLQLNAVSITDDRPFRDWSNILSLSLPYYHITVGSEALPDSSYYSVTGIVENQQIYGAETSPFYSGTSRFRICNKFYPTTEGQKVVDFFFDPDFMGTWIHIIEPNPELEILIECVCNYEVICYPNSPYYTFQGYNEKMDVQLKDVKNMVESVYGSLFCWDEATARDVSRSIDKMLINNPTFGSSTGRAVQDSNYVALRGGALDNGVLSNLMNKEEDPPGSPPSDGDPSSGGGGGHRPHDDHGEEEEEPSASLLSRYPVALTRRREERREDQRGIGRPRRLEDYQNEYLSRKRARYLSNDRSVYYY